MSPQRPSGRRFAAFVAALALCSSAFGAVVLPRLGDSSVPASLKAKPTLVQQKLDDGRCHKRYVETDLALQARA